MQLTLGGNENLGQLQQRAEDVLKKDLEAIRGVARIELLGGLQREIQVQVDQHKLEAHGLSILQVSQALSVDNLNLPAGNVTQPDKDDPDPRNASPVAHAYHWSSINFLEQGGYPISLTVTWSAEFSANGGGFHGNPGGDRRFDGPHPGRPNPAIGQLWAETRARRHTPPTR